MSERDPQSNLPKLRLVVVANDPLARAGLASLLGDQPDFSVVDQLGAGPFVDAALERSQPDVVVWDLGWELSDQLDTMALVAEGGPPIMALIADESLASALWAAGAYGILPRESDSLRLESALRALADGLIVIDPTISPSLPTFSRAAEPAPSESLTEREVEVLKLLAEGLSNKAIADTLSISEHTVKFHVNAIFGKLGVNSRTEAAVRAVRLGLITF